uniref:Isoform 4 of Myelin-oligodendrocyte glycoprotein n=1 Tax=Callithrix jacchus TaxID=9483 RepID=Q29ZQ1-4|nr:MOG alpha-4Cj [Callithrix jacchus]
MASLSKPSLPSYLCFLLLLLHVSSSYGEMARIKMESRHLNIGVEQSC